MIFDWDPAKAEHNLNHHGVSFEEACEAFLDPNAVDEYDGPHSDDEARYNLTGLSGRRLLFVVYTEKPGPVIWLISARKAEGSKRKRYEKTQN